MSRYGLLDPTLIKNINYEAQEEQIRQAIIDLKNDPDKVEAIFFCSRRVFITGIKYMHRESIRIPEEMEIICFDKIDTISIANIPINYIEQPIKRMGEQAVEILMEQINGNNEIKQLVFDTEIKHSI
jgi:LacI family transcriptional regulator